MRDFSDADRKKKSKRIQLPENPGNLPPEALSRLEEAVRAAVKDGYLACAAGWKVARDLGVSRLDVGATIDRLGIRVAQCRLGCFKFEKTPYGGAPSEPLPEEVVRRVAALAANGELTCANAFALAHELNVGSAVVAEAANAGGHKIRECQLGCF